MDKPLEEKKEEITSVWTEEQMEEWIYSFVAEIQNFESKNPAVSAEAPGKNSPPFSFQ
jgi:hypothetical protein